MNKNRQFRLIALLAVLPMLAGCSQWFKPPRCTIPGCHVRMLHLHDDGEYRGVAWWKRNKNPKVGQGYKRSYIYNYQKN